jgi:putative oxidoreductase
MATLAAPSPQTQTTRALHVALWVAQALLGAAFILAGSSKALQPMSNLATQMPWTAVVGEPLTRFIGISELLGGLGLILPAATRIRPILTPLAAAGVTLVMILAAVFHAARGEWSALPVNFFLGGLAAFIAWGRYSKVPVAPRES